MNRISRYGKIPVFHQLHILNIVMLLLMFILDYTKIITYIVWCINIFFLYKQISPFFEKFHIECDMISINFMKGSYTKKIPDNAVFVLSYTDVNGFSYSFKNRYMINIVADCVENIFCGLHSSEFEKYCNSVRLGFGFGKKVYDNRCMEIYFKNRYIYSFAYEQEFANKFFNEQKKTVIIPRSLADKIQVQANGFEVLFDEER